MKHKVVLKWLFPVLLLLVAYKVQKTQYNWDVVFYCGAIFNNPDNPTASRENMIAAFKNSPYIDYEKDIIPKTQYGRDVFSNNQSYEEQYAFYDIRVVYIKTIQAFHALGEDAVYSVYLASLFYALSAVLVLYFFCFGITGNALFSFLVGLFMILRPGFRDFITSSPDTLSAFSVILIIIAFFSKKEWWMYASIAFSILCRTDNLIFIGLLYGISLIEQLVSKKTYRVYAAGIILALTMYFVINLIYHNAGYRVLYYHTFIEHLSFPLTQPKVIPYTDILKRIIPDIPYFIYPLMYFLIILVMVQGRYKQIFSEPALLVAVVAIITFIIRFCLFPSAQARFTFQYEFIAMMILVYYFRQQLFAFFNPEKKGI